MSSIEKPDMLCWLGFRRPMDWLKARWLGSLLSVFLVAILAMALAVVFAVFAHALFGLPLDAPRIGFGTGTVAVAVIGAPFVIWRSYVAQRQVNTQDDALFNDKINAAAEGLASRRQVTRVIGVGDKMRVLEEREDDLVTRAAAIDRLEGLAYERPEEMARIARLLSVYVCQLSKEHPSVEPPVDQTLTSLDDWAKELKVARSDMEKAVQAIGRLNQASGSLNIFLGGANLQGMNLRKVNLQNAVLSRVALDGSDLTEAQFDGARLWNASAIGVLATQCSFRDSILVKVNMSVSNAVSANFDNTLAKGISFNGSVLNRASFKSAFLPAANLDSANFSNADFESCSVSRSSAIGTKFVNSNFSKAYIGRMKVSAPSRQFRGAILNGAAARNPDESMLPLLVKHQKRVFCALPNGSKAWRVAPDHWVRITGPKNEFHKKWREWQANQ